MSIIDFHAHILPELDDGSSSVEKTLQMRRISRKSGVDRIVATPHFYAHQDRIEDFLQRREASYYKMQQAVCDAEPELSELKIVPGAEVAYFEGISEAEKISQLTVQDTSLLLLELPFEEWKNTIYQEVESLLRDRGMKVMLAHFERYLAIPGNKKKMRELLELPVCVQINAGSLLDWKRRRGTQKLIERSSACVLGSDMHGIGHRPPNLGEGRQILRKKYGSSLLEEIDAVGSSLLNI